MKREARKKFVVEETVQVDRNGTEPDEMVNVDRPVVRMFTQRTHHGSLGDEDC